MRLIPHLLLALLVGITVSACRPRQLRGQVFVVAADGSTRRLGGLQVQVYPATYVAAWREQNAKRLADLRAKVADAESLRRANIEEVKSVIAAAEAQLKEYNAQRDRCGAQMLEHKAAWDEYESRTKRQIAATAAWQAKLQTAGRGAKTLEEKTRIIGEAAEEREELRRGLQQVLADEPAAGKRLQAAKDLAPEYDRLTAKITETTAKIQTDTARLPSFDLPVLEARSRLVEATERSLKGLDPAKALQTTVTDADGQFTILDREKDVYLAAYSNATQRHSWLLPRAQWEPLLLTNHNFLRLEEGAEAKPAATPAVETAAR